MIDGLADEVSFPSLSSEASFPVDQSDLPRDVVQDAEEMFSGDNVMKHMNNLFDGQSVAQFVTGDKEVHVLLLPIIIIK